MARRAKYSVQQKAFATAVQGNTTTTIEVVPSTVVEGMRKVKHITVNASIQGTAASAATDAMYWAIVYVPQGTTPNAINIATAASTPGMYEPNQFVMNCGVWLMGQLALSASLLQLAVTSTMATPSTSSSVLWHLQLDRPLPSSLLCAMLSPLLNNSP